MAGEGLVVVHAVGQLHVGRHIGVAGQQRVDIVGAALLVAVDDVPQHVERMRQQRAVILDAARLGDQRQIRRQRAVLGRAGRLVVVVGPEDRIRGPRRPLDDLRPCGSRSRPGRWDRRRSGSARRRPAPSPPPRESPGPPGSARLRKLITLQAVAGRADLLIDLEAALQLRLVELAASRPANVHFWRVDLGGARRRRTPAGERAARLAAPAARERPSCAKDVVMVGLSASALLRGCGRAGRRAGAPLAEHRLRDGARHRRSASRCTPTIGMITRKNRK